LSLAIRTFAEQGGIAAGWMGSRSHAYGGPSAALGALSHAAIATVMVMAYDALARRPGRQWIRDRCIESGVLYGVVLFGIMNLVVVPLSHASAVPWSEVEWHAGSFLMHVLIGVLCTAPQARSHRVEPLRWCRKIMALARARRRRHRSLGTPHTGGMAQLSAQAAGGRCDNED
jgi:hypothetical protein